MTADKRTLRFSLCIIVALLLCLLLTGCSNNKEEQFIRDTVTTFLDEYKNPALEKMPDLVDADTRRAYDQLELYNVDGYAIAQQYLAKFSYTIDEVSVKGDQATVSVTMKNIDVASVVESTLSKYSSDKGTETIAQLQKEGGDNLVYQQIYSELFDRLKAATDIVSTPTALTFTKTNGSWVLDESCIPTVMAAIYGGKGIDIML